MRQPRRARRRSSARPTAFATGPVLVCDHGTANQTPTRPADDARLHAELGVIKLIELEFKLRLNIQRSAAATIDAEA